MSLLSFPSLSLKTLKKSKSMEITNTSYHENEISKIKQIGNYKLGPVIGRGAFGKVILGEHITTNEKVAIKILDKLIINKTPGDYKLVKQELSILKIVKHKNIVQLYDVLETSRFIFFVMEYCEGGDMITYILSRKRLSEFESLKFFHQLINALYYLHCQNITHRDIKIDNLLLDSENNLKLIDFGLSTKYNDDELLSQACGTIVYAAPEVLDFKKYNGMLVDVWSSGIVLYGMLSGSLPFGDSCDEINKKKILKGKIVMPSFLSEDAKDILIHMLDINPLTRFTLEDIIDHSWFNKTKFKIIPGIIIGINKIPVDETILNLCVTYNVDKNKVKKSILNNIYNTESAIYYLLVQKMKKAGYDSVSDLYSKKYIDFMLKQGNEFLTSINVDIPETQEINRNNKIIQNKYNKSIRNLDNLKIHYNDFNSKENINKYINVKLDSVPKLDKEVKKVINIENNYNNNIIILDEKNKRYETSRNKENTSNLFEKIFSHNLINNYETNENIPQEILNNNSLETDRIISKGKLLKNIKFIGIRKSRDKNQKNIFSIRNKIFPLDKSINKKNNKTLENNKDNKTKNIYININKNNGIFNNSKNNEKFPIMKNSESNRLVINNDSIFNTCAKMLYMKNQKKEKNIQKTGKHFNNIINMKKKFLHRNLNNASIKILQRGNSYLRKNKFITSAVNTSRFNMTNKNKFKESIKKIINKNNLKLNNIDNTNFVGKNNGTMKNKSKDKRNTIIKTQIQYNKSKKKLILNNLSKDPNKIRIGGKLKNTIDSQSKKNMISKEKDNKIFDYTSINEKKLDKTNIQTLLDNFCLYHKFPSKIKKRNINNKFNNKIKNDIQFNDIIPNEYSERNTAANNNNSYIFKKYGLKKNINDINNDNNLNSMILYNNIMKINKNKINNGIFNMNIACKNKANKILNIDINNIDTNPLISNRNKISLISESTFDDKEKSNTSRISAKFRHKKQRKRNLDINFFFNKLNNISGSSLNNNTFQKQAQTIDMSDKSSIKVNSLPKFSKHNFNKSNKIPNNNKVKNIKINSLVDSFCKKNSIQDDLEFISSQKNLEVTANNKKIKRKIKCKINDDKYDSFKTLNNYIKTIQINKNNPFINKNNLKKMINHQKSRISKNDLILKDGNKFLNQNSNIKIELTNNSHNYDKNYNLAKKSSNNLKNKIDIQPTNLIKLVNNTINVNYYNNNKKNETKNNFKNKKFPKIAGNKLIKKYKNKNYLTRININNNKTFEMIGKNFPYVHNKISDINFFIQEYKF